MRGFSLVELMVAMAITLLVMAAALPLLGPAHDAFHVQPESADVQQRIRVGTDALRRDLLMAGAGLYVAGAIGPLHHAIAPIMPYRAFVSPGNEGTFRADTVSLLYVPSTPSQTTLAMPLIAGSKEMSLDGLATCPAPSAATFCGFAADDHVLVFDRDGGWSVFEIEVVNSLTGQLQLKTVAARGFATGSSVTEVEALTYLARPDPQTGASQLARGRAYGPAQTLVDYVVALSFAYLGDPQPPLILEGDPEDTSDDRSTYGPLPPDSEVTVDGWPAGENCVFTRVEGRPEPRLPPVGATTLVPLSSALVTDGPWCPNPSAPHRFDADLLRIRRVRFTLRVQTALAVLRGPAGPLFAIGGSARAASRYVPDLQVTFDVAPRNLNASR